MKHPLRYIYVLVTILLIQGALTAQIDEIKNENFIDYLTEPKEYEIGSVVIEGAGTRDKNVIKSMAGLRAGKKITIPGDDLSNGLKALFKLRLFENVEIYQDSIKDDVVFLRIKLIERPTLSSYTFNGVKSAKHEDLGEIVDGILNIGGIVTINGLELSKKKIAEYYIEKGFLDTEVKTKEIKDKSKASAVLLEYNIIKNDKVKIDDITFNGNTVLKDKKLRKLLKKTKKKGTFLKNSKYIKKQYEEDKDNLIAHYNKLGFRDAIISSDSIWRNEDGLVMMQININEGNQYVFRNITWKGNSLYTDNQLSSVLGISPGDVYNKEELEQRLSFSQDGRDISSLYLDEGYLFFDVKTIETSVVNDSIDIELRISEGAQATIANVTINGNDRTNEHVIRRELRTKPGEKFSRSDIIRSQRQIINLGYFNPETLDIQTPVNPAQGTVDIIYQVEEQPSDQLELSAGYGGFSGLIGTLGVTFNNFSIQNIKDRSTWNPLPQGDGQKLSLRIQSNSRFFRSYNFSFTEPWLGGEKPNSFTVGFAASIFDQSTFGQGKLAINRGFIGLGTQLKWPDDFFISNTVLNIESINLDEFRTRFPVSTGNFKNFNINQTFVRSSVVNPIFPTTGSKVSLSIQLTPPYSLFRSDDFWVLTDSEKESAIFEESRRRGIRNRLTPEGEVELIQDLEDARRFGFLEYHKWRFDSEWYFGFSKKMVLMASAKMGYLGAYNSNIGVVPFERFEFGGDGLSNQQSGITGTDIVSMRGYEANEFPGNGTFDSGGVIFNKFTTELRYALSTNPSSTIYAHAFLQGGNVWQSFRDYNPFGLQRSVGGGLRVFLPMFGLLGFDYGWGIDKDRNASNFPGFGKFSIVLGFEPD